MIWTSGVSNGSPGAYDAEVVCPLPWPSPARNSMADPEQQTALALPADHAEFREYWLRRQIERQPAQNAAHPIDGRKLRLSRDHAVSPSALWTDDPSNARCADSSVELLLNGDGCTWRDAECSALHGQNSPLEDQVVSIGIADKVDRVHVAVFKVHIVHLATPRAKGDSTYLCPNACHTAHPAGLQR